MTAQHKERARFDWDGAKARLRAATVRAEESVDSVFARRAAELAAIPERTRAAGTPHLVFEVSGDLFAVPMDAVSLVLKAPSLDPVPFAPNVLDRVLLVQGHFVSVYDLSLHAGRKRTAGQVVIVLSGSERLGIRADAMLGLDLIDTSALIRPREEGGNLDPILNGITSERVQVIDVTRLSSRAPQ